MYNNFSKLTNKSLSIATASIDIILTVVSLLIGLNYESNVLWGFILIAISFVMLSISSVITFIKCVKFGDKYAHESNPPKDADAKNFATLNTLISVFTILFFVLFIIGVILLFKQ